MKKYLGSGNDVFPPNWNSPSEQKGGFGGHDDDYYKNYDYNEEGRSKENYDYKKNRSDVDNIFTILLPYIAEYLAYLYDIEDFLNLLNETSYVSPHARLLFQNIPMNFYLEMDGLNQLVEKIVDKLEDKLSVSGIYFVPEQIVSIKNDLNKATKRMYSSSYNLVNMYEGLIVELKKIARNDYNYYKI